MADEQRINGELLRGGLTTDQQRAEAARIEALRDNLLDIAIDTDTGRFQQFLGNVQAQQNRIAELENERINNSMAAAHQEYGVEFERAYNALTTMDPNNRLAREIVQSVTSARDPGRALMELHGNDLVNSLNSGRPPPSCPGHVGPHRAGNPAISPSDDSGWGNRQSRGTSSLTSMED